MGLGGKDFNEIFLAPLALAKGSKCFMLYSTFYGLYGKCVGIQNFENFERPVLFG